MHPFSLLKKREIDACLARAQEAMREWKANWCPAAAFEIECLPACDVAMGLRDGHWRAHGAAGDTALWCFQTAGFARQIEHTVFNLDHASRSKDRRATSDIAERVAAEAGESLAASLLHHLSAAPLASRPDAGSLPAWLFRRSAGAALLRVGSGDNRLCILIPNALLPGKSKPVRQAALEPVTPLATALTGITAHLRAELGQVEMTLGQLNSLALGDVITLPVGIDQPLKLFAGKRHLVSLAYLGKQDGNRAVEVFAADKQ